MSYLLTTIFSVLFSISLFASPFKSITLEEFGAMDNKNMSLQSENVIIKGPFRTNNYQNLEQAFNLNRMPIRIGNIYVSSSIYKDENDPGGPAINSPATQINNYSFILTPHDDSSFIFSCKEVNSSNQYIREGELPTSETLIINYTLSNDSSKKIIDYNITGNAYHDIYYQNVTPLIQILHNNPIFEEIAVDDEIIEGPYNGISLPKGSKFRLKLNNNQTWLIYVEKTKSKVKFDVNETNCALIGSKTFTGFFRVAIIQADEVKRIDDPTLCPAFKGEKNPPCIDWSTAAEIQSLPANPVNMYMLWPKEWIKNIGKQMVDLIDKDHFPPSCDVLSQLLPVLARYDFETANTYFKQISNDSFDNGVNAFSVYFNMLMASKLKDDIDNYQSEYCSYPTYHVNATDETVEKIFDQYRHNIPIFADVFFDENGYSWKYKLAKKTGNPLIIFPGYKQLDASYNVESRYIHKDPVKGPIYAAEAKNNKIAFTTRKLPSWYNDFYPKDLQFTEDELSTLQQLLTQACSETLPADNSYFMGKRLYKFALTTKYGEFVLEALNKSKEEIVDQLNPLISQMKDQFENWFILREGADNYFVGDKTVTGLCATPLGMQDDNCSGNDFCNAIYTDHHFHYGYWLASAAAIIEWDDKYETDPSKVWIAQMKTSKDGHGLFKMKYFVDMLFRDTKNPFKDDINPNNKEEHFPFNRHGNTWEGHSTANGMQCGLYGDGRNQESLAEDFHSWLGCGNYARAILNSSTLDDEDKKGFNQLKTFCETNMAMTAGSGKLYYKDDNWIYSNNFAEVNCTVGNQYDCKIDQQTFFTPGAIACIKKLEEIVLKEELPTETVLPIEPELPTETVLPTEPELPAETSLPAEPELITESELQTEPELLTETSLPIETDLPTETELPTETVLPAQTELPEKTDFPTKEKINNYANTLLNHFGNNIRLENIDHIIQLSNNYISSWPDLNNNLKIKYIIDILDNIYEKTKELNPNSNFSSPITKRIYRSKIHMFFMRQ